MGMDQPRAEVSTRYEDVDLCHWLVNKGMGKGGTYMNDRLMTRKEVAEYLHVCQRTADRYINGGKFDGIVHVGRRVLVSMNKLEKYIEEIHESKL